MENFTCSAVRVFPSRWRIPFFTDALLIIDAESRAVMDAYAAGGYPDEWQLHHQGGPASYDARDVIANPGVKVEDVQKAISHPQALGQCAEYLRSHGIKAEQVYDTAGSVKMLKASGERTTAAIASRRACMTKQSL